MDNRKRKQENISSMITFIKKNLKNILLLIALFLAAPIAVNYIIFLGRLPSVFGNSDNWLSFWGNYTGGILSAVVAYIVAKLQIRNQRILDRRKEIIGQLPSLLRIEIELKKYYPEILRVKEHRENLIQANGGLCTFETDEEEGISEYELNKMQYKIEMFDEEHFKLLENISDINLHIDLIKCFQFYKEFSTALNLDITSLEKRLNEIVKEQVSHFESFDRANINLTQEANTITGYQISIEELKEKAWKKLKEGKVTDQFLIVIKDVEKEIEKVKDIKENEEITL
ncbi:hypothetical protein SAMN05428981_103411 [Bacillus sp. OV194]|nr:hypothetical protein SAMN05428981_103411 [Bacillus sp. OV194]